jgi:hypothetical protein
MKTATIVIKDEVNIRIEGLDLDTRKALVRAFKYEDPTARFRPAYRLGRWDGKVGFFQLGGSTFVNLLPEIVPILERYDYDIDLDDQRDYATQFEFSSVQEDSFAHIAWGTGHPLAGQPIQLRDYQVRIVNDFLSNPQCLQEVATGAGKCLAGNTKLCVGIDETTAFGQFLINKLQQEQENEVTRNNNKI